MTDNMEKNVAKRWNFYPLITIKNGTIYCEKENYSIDELCRCNAVENTYGRKTCTLNGTAYELYPQ